MNLADLLAQLEQYGWSADQVDDRVLAAGLLVGENSFLVLFQLDEPWLRIVLPALVPGTQADRLPVLMQLALELNHSARLARFAIDDRGQLVLCLDLNIEHGLAYQDLELALDVLTYLADATYERLMSASVPETMEETREDDGLS